MSHTSLLAQSAPADQRGQSVREPRARTLAGRPGVAAAAFTSGDGVGYVALLLRRAIGELASSPLWLAELRHVGHGPVPAARRARFVASLVAAQLARRVDWLLFAHLGVARAQQLVPRPARCPYGVFVHGVEVWGEPLSAGRAAVLRDAAVCIANSRFTARRLVDARPELRPPLVCHLALLDDTTAASDASRLDADERALLERAGHGFALVTGRMSASERYKGHDELIACWPAVRARVPAARLVVVGGGDDAPRLDAAARDAGLGESIVFTGRVSDTLLAELYRRAALFTMPSRGEGFGLVYLEAMRAGLPCVASTDDAASEIVVDGETGLLVAQRDRDALAGAVARLLSDDALARSFGAAGRARFDARFRFPAFRDRLGEILRATFGESRGGPA